VQARVIDELQAEVTELRAEVAQSRSENAELKRRLGMDSTNSSKPPSSDGWEKEATRSQRLRSKDRRPGGRPGRAGRSLQPVAEPDRVERIEPAECADCNNPLSDAPAREWTPCSSCALSLFVVLKFMHSDGRECE
jgi:hypothetical protein